jgi:hypothetical protein
MKNDASLPTSAAWRRRRAIPRADAELEDLEENAREAVQRACEREPEAFTLLDGGERMAILTAMAVLPMLSPELMKPSEEPACFRAPEGLRLEEFTSPFTSRFTYTIGRSDTSSTAGEGGVYLLCCRTTRGEARALALEIRNHPRGPPEFTSSGQARELWSDDWGGHGRSAMVWALRTLELLGEDAGADDDEPFWIYYTGETWSTSSDSKTQLGASG